MNFASPHFLPRGVRFARRFLLCLAFVLCLVGLARVASAKPDFPPVVRTATGLKTGGEVDKANTSCKLCHSPSPPKLNPYGTDLKGALQQANTKALTPAALKAIDDKDSDGDGFANSAEVAADTLPGEGASKPAGAPTSTPAPSTAPPAEAAGLFSPKTLFTPDHAQHPVIVHFPIALFFISVLFDLLGNWKKQPGLHQAATYNLVAAAISSPIAIVTGLIAWQVKFGGAPLDGVLLWHLLAGVASSLLLLALWWTRTQMNKKPGSGYRRLYVGLSVLLVAVISLAGHLGGALVYGL
jgi:uncharacterized membrane protein